MNAHTDPTEVAGYVASGRWPTHGLARLVARHADDRPDEPAFITPESGATSWAALYRRALQMAAALITADIDPGQRVAVFVPDGPDVHAALLATELAGVVAVGIGARSGDREVTHLLTKTAAVAVVTPAEHRGRSLTEAYGEWRRLCPSLNRHIVIDDLPDPSARDATVVETASRTIDPLTVSLINSTSGTTGLPKCVLHNQARWFAFHQMAAAAGELDERDVFLAAIPAPFGFGLWTSHFTPTILGTPTVVMPRFDADVALSMIERHRVTVLCCVSTQFLMMLNSPRIADHDLSSLRVMFTGGERVPYDQAAAFEDRTGAQVLQFYGSNETGAISCTRTTDSREVRLRTAGRVIDEMQVRLFDDNGRDVTDQGRGQPAVRGPATCFGYLDDETANSQLFTEEGWMLAADLVTIEDGILTVEGRVSDFIIRGGKNISAAAVEGEVLSHPAVAMVAAVAMPDPIFGERVCAFVELHPGAQLDLADLVRHLRERGVTPEWWPEHLVVVETLPRAAGAKVAKGELRARAAEIADAPDTGAGELDIAPDHTAAAPLPDTGDRAGGRSVWSPSVVPPIGAELDARQELACAFRILAGTGFGENIAGHITLALDDGSMWVNPWGLWWEEITASDLCRVSPDGEVLEGRWDVTPAIHIHTQLHRRRPDARVVVHNHPLAVTALAAIGELPPIHHQTGSMLHDEMVFVDEYDGEVDDADRGAGLAAAIGEAHTVLLANHGLLVTGTSVPEATYRAVTAQRAAELACLVMTTGKPASVIPPGLRGGVRASLLERGTDIYWAGAVRQLLRTQREVLD